MVKVPDNETSPLVCGDVVEYVDRPGVEMRVDNVGKSIEGTLFFACVWPLFTNGDPPLYRRSFIRGELRRLRMAHEERAGEPSRRPPQASDMGVLVQPTPRVSSTTLDAMERDGWTPLLVRTLIADYRRLAGYAHE